MIRKNSLREKLNANEPSLGTRLHIPYPNLIEVLGYTGQYDYIEILSEYTAFDLRDIENQARAINLFPSMSGMIKLGQGLRDFLTAKALDSGIQNILFADIRTVEDAKECIALVRGDSPDVGGIRSAGMGRDSGIVMQNGSPEYLQSTRDSVVALMIEKKGAVENLEEILSLPGVDMIQVGRTDYSMSIGRVGQANHPEIKEIEAHVIKTALNMGIQPRAEIGNAEGAEYYLNMGVRHFSVGTDMRVLYDWYKDNGEKLQDIFKGI